MAQKKFLQILLLIGDIVLMYLGLVLTLAIRYEGFSYLVKPQTKALFFHFSFIFLFWALILFALDFYKIPPFRKIFDFLKNLLIFISLAAILGIIYFYLAPQSNVTPKTILILDLLIFSILLLGWRCLFSQILKLQNLKEKIIMIIDSKEARDLPQELLRQNGYEVMAYFNPEEDINFSKIKEIVEKEKINLIVFSSNFYKNKKKTQQLFQHLPLKINCLSFTNFYENVTKKVSLETIDEVWLLENISGPERKFQEFLKRGLDILFSIIGLLILVVLLPFIALAIKIDSPGPIFYTQKRIGKDGKIFTLYKFRTMKADAEKQGPQWSLPNDSRITSVGKILRSLHLDEFPQFFNILKGDISFVGPRPERPAFVEQLKKEIPFYDVRHIVKPGFTGWAQINYHYGASVKEAEEKLRYDLYYIKNRSFFLDISIILKTIQLFFR